MLLRTILAQLTEALHQAFRIPGTESLTGIDDVEIQQEFGVFHNDRLIMVNGATDVDFSLRGELDSVTHQVDEYLSDSEPIPNNHGRHIHIHQIVDFETLVNGPRRHGVDHIFDHGPNMEPRVYQRHFSGFHARDIQNVVD